jgi:NADH:ubiquinone oxidoreductase subunit D
MGILTIVYLVRLEEMRQSLKIIYFCLETLEEGPIKVNDFKYNVPERFLMKSQMESLIHHFRYFAGGFEVGMGEEYVVVEAPKGEFVWRLFMFVLVIALIAVI